MLKLTFMAKITNEVYLRGNCQLHSGLSYDKKSLISVSVETRNLETKIFCFLIYGKNAYHAIS